MAKKRKADVVDGFMTFKAAQQAEKEGIRPEAVPAKSEPGKSRDKAVLTASRISRTAMPTRVEIVCYACGFPYDIVGKSHNTMCPKCRERIDIKDYVIDAPWEKDILTAGKVTIKPEAVITSGKLVGNHVIVQGRIEGGRVRATSKMEWHPGSDFKESQMEWTDLVIGLGLDYTSRKQEFSCRNLTVNGRFKGKLHVTGLLKISAGAAVQGQVHGAHLEIAEGGGLIADMDIDPSRHAEAVDPKKKIRKSK